MVFFSPPNMTTQKHFILVQSEVKQQNNVLTGLIWVQGISLKTLCYSGYQCDHSILSDVNPLVVAFIQLLYLVIIKVTVMTEQCRADSALTRDVVCLLTLQAQAGSLSLICCDAAESTRRNTPHPHHHKTDTQ